MKQIKKLLALQSLLIAVVLHSSAESIVSSPGHNEDEKAVSEYPHFFEGLPPGVTEENKSKDSLTYYFHKPQKNVDVEIYDENEVLINKDSRSVGRNEKVSYSLPQAEEGKRLVLIRCEDGEVYGNNY